MKMIRFCPGCKTERPQHEFFCEGVVNGHSCGWDLSAEPFHPEGWRPVELIPSDLPKSARRVCENGHEVETGDLFCIICGADVAEAKADGVVSVDSCISDTPNIAGWRVEASMSCTSGTCERFRVLRDDGQVAVLELYRTGFEPEPKIYAALEGISHEHVPEIYAHGRWEGRAYLIMEMFTGKTLADIGTVIAEGDPLRHVVTELGAALDALSEAGIRHRYLNPRVLLVRNDDPLDLVISGFGSARLSDFDLDIVAPLETNVYMAPEALVGAVSPASDWWSLGMILLEQLIGGEGFTRINPRALLIQTLSGNIALPEGIDETTRALLTGLLTRDHNLRWQWQEVSGWLRNDYSVPISPSLVDGEAQKEGISIELGGVAYRTAARFALHAGEEERWDEASNLLHSGALATWLAARGSSAAEALRRMSERWRSLSEDFRLMLALKLLNRDMPLVLRGEVITPGWLLANPISGYDLIAGDTPQLLREFGFEEHDWLEHLQGRAIRVRQQAEQSGVILNEEALRVYLLNTSQTRLQAVWTERLKVFPEARHSRLVFLMECPQLLDNDLILLLSAQLHYFRSADEVYEDVVLLSREAGLDKPSFAAVQHWLGVSRPELYRILSERLGQFAYCDIALPDRYARDFRLRKRLPLPQALLLACVPEHIWQTPSRQRYLVDLLEYFEKKIRLSAARGSLVRMNTGLNSSNVDVMDLETPRLSAVGLVEHVICRQSQPRRLDPLAFSTLRDPDRDQPDRYGFQRTLLNRLIRLSRKDDQYRKETGQEGLYLGFPFLVRAPQVRTQLPRVMPLLLWPVKLTIAARSSEQVALAFDSGREEVRLNPVLEQFVGSLIFEKYDKTLTDLLQRSTLDVASVMAAMSHLAVSCDDSLQRLDPQQRKPAEGGDYLACAAVLFHSSFTGQALGADLRALRDLPPVGAFSTILDLPDSEVLDAAPKTSAENRYLITESDPSQDAAIRKAMLPTGLLVEGPPGTGKSQTIVNIVAEAISSGKSVLIVCQKRAALDVVHKRLAASGLGDRLALVGDVGRDRRYLIKAIREQLDNLFRMPANGRDDIEAHRAKVVEGIERCENVLNSVHEALYAVDSRIGTSYRALLGELIALAEREIISAPQVRASLEGLNLREAEEVEAQCVPIVRLWLASRYEDSPLAPVCSFEPSQENIQKLFGLLEAFAASEEARAKDLRTAGKMVRLSGDESAYRTVSDWFTEQSPQFETLSEEDRVSLRNWLPLFKTPDHTALSRGRRIAANLRDLFQEAEADPPPQSSPFLQALSRLNETQLGRLQTALALCLGPLPLWRKCLPDYWLKRREIAKFLTTCAGGALDASTLRALEATLNWECRMRPRLRRLRVVEDELRLMTPGSNESARLLSVTERYLWTLEHLGTLLESLACLPENNFLERAIATTSAEEWKRALATYVHSCSTWRLRLDSLARLAGLTSWLKEDFLAQLHAGIDADQDAHPLLMPLMERLHEMEPYQRFRAQLPFLGDPAMSFFRLLRKSERQLADVAPDKIEEAVRCTIRYEVRCAWKARLERERPELTTDASREEKTVQTLAEANRTLMTLNRALLKSVDTGFMARKSAWEDITRLTGARARSLRDFFKEALPLGLLTFRPVWMMNPDTASRLLPLKPSLFDLIVYDEASQLPVEYAVPTLFRAQTAVVSGDEKQMPPSRFFNAALPTEEGGHEETGDEERALAEEERRDFLEVSDCTDILQLGRRALPRRMLEIHYRSRYGELIDFSNRAFYGGRLNIPNRHSTKELDAARPLEFIEVNGLYENQTNRKEAACVVRILKKLWSRPSDRCPSVGVVTFNQKQAELIEDVLEEAVSCDAGFGVRYEEESQRTEDGENMSFFVKSVENVQGDERDIIVFSSTFGRDASGRFSRNFGILGQRLGERRLNVAITRARRKVVLVNSMPLHQISDMLATQRMAMLPRDYLQMYWAYARAMSIGDFELAKTYLSRVGGGAAYRFSEIAVQDDFQRIVAQEVAALGWAVACPAESEGDVFTVEFLLKSPRTGRYFIGVECDTPRHPLLHGAQAREIWRPAVLHKVVPTVHRVSSRAWWIDSRREREKLKQAIDEAYAREGAVG